MGTWNPDAKRDGCLAGHRQAASKADTAHPSSLSLWAQWGLGANPQSDWSMFHLAEKCLLTNFKKKNKEKSRACVLVCFLYSSHSICTLKKFMRNPHTCSIFSVLTLDLHKIWLRKHEPFKKKSHNEKNVSATILLYVKIFIDVSWQGLLCLWLSGISSLSQRSTSLCLLNAGIEGTRQHTRLTVSFDKLKFEVF